MEQAIEKTEQIKLITPDYFQSIGMDIQTLKKRAAEAQLFILDNLEDKVKIKLITDEWRLFKDTRIAVERMRKEANETALKFQRNNNSLAKEITEILSPGETHLRGELKKIEDEEERKKQEIENMILNKIKERKEMLKNLGMLIQADNSMTFDDYEINEHSLRHMSRNEFMSFFEDVKNHSIKVEQERKLQEEKQREAEILRLRTEQRGKELRSLIKFVRDYDWMINLPDDEYLKELVFVKRDQALFEEEEEKKRNELEKLKKEKADLLLSREKRLYSIGLAKGEGKYYFANIVIQQSIISDMLSTEFEDLITETEQKVKEKRAAIEKSLKDQKEIEEEEKRKKIAATEEAKKEKERQEALFREDQPHVDYFLERIKAIQTLDWKSEKGKELANCDEVKKLIQKLSALAEVPQPN